MPFRFVAQVTVFDKNAYTTDQFRRNVYLGDPINCVNVLSDQRCQELFLSFTQDEEHDIAFVRAVLSVCRAPVAVGGFGSNLDEILSVVKCGAEKVIVSDSLWFDTAKVEMLIELLGAQAVAGSIDFVEEASGRQVVSGKDRSEIVCPLEEALEMVRKLGLGEIVLNNVSRDGSLAGADYSVYEIARKAISSTPLLISGGYKGEIPDASLRQEDGLVSSSYVSLFGSHRTPLLNYPENYKVAG